MLAGGWGMVMVRMRREVMMVLVVVRMEASEAGSTATVTRPTSRPVHNRRVGVVDGTALGNRNGAGLGTRRESGRQHVCRRGSLIACFAPADAPSDLVNHCDCPPVLHGSFQTAGENALGASTDTTRHLKCTCGSNRA